MEKRLTSCIAGLAAAGALEAWAGVQDYDYDGDGRADIAVYHSKKGDWYIRQSQTGQLRFQNWGWNQSQPVSGDFDGDGKADICVYDGRGAKWYILRSSTRATEITEGWGSHDQDPVCGDFDGDGKNDLALYHPPSGAWHVLQSSNGKQVRTVWGTPTTEPVPGDYDGDGKTDLAVYDRAQGNWFIVSSKSGIPSVQNWGWSEAEPVQADYDGDGKTDIAVLHAATGDWYIRLSSQNGALRLIKSGWKNMQPVQADYDGDGQADIAVYNHALGNWQILYSRTGQVGVQNWGWFESEPALSAYRVDDDGRYYNHSYGHDYDEDTFENSGEYPRTGWRSNPAPTPNPPAGGGTVQPTDLLPSQVQWLKSRGPDYSKAKTVLALSKVSISGKRCYFTSTPAIPWRVRGEKNINAIGILIRKINGKFVGGKCEWVVGSRGWYDCRTNVADGYNGHTMPVSGEIVWVGIGHPDNGSEISQLIATRWP